MTSEDLLSEEVRLSDSKAVDSSDYMYAVSQEFERDARRYNRAYLDEQEVGAR